MRYPTPGTTRSGTRFVAVGAVLVAMALIPPSGASARPVRPSSAAAHHRLAVTGFVEEGTSDSRIANNAKALTTVGVDGVNVSRRGSSVPAPDADARRALRIAHADHLRAEFLVGNFGAHDFSPAIAHRLLSSPAHIKAVVASLAHSVSHQDWDGVSVDLESLETRDRAGLTQFLLALRRALATGTSLSICVQNAGSPAAFRAQGYELAAIGRTVSRVILMAYDEHGPWENSPGPIGALRWQRRGLEVVLHLVPRAKVDLGQAGYGYAWRPHSNDLLSDARARQLSSQPGAQRHFDPTVGEWTARMRDGSTLWWADARSYRLRVALAKHDHLHGLAVWSLGLSDRLR